MSRLGYERQKEYKSFVDGLTPIERGIYADMIMRSLRGSWRQPRPRTQILELIAGTGDVKYYEPSKLRKWVKQYFERIGRGDSDGRYWRRHYENADLKVTTLSEETVRDLASHIPNDMTWDDYRINKEFGD